MPGPVGPELRLPVSRVFLHHTVTSVSSDPIADARRVANVTIARFGRMSYSVLIHPARVIFWAETEHQGVHTAGYNSSSVAISLVGDYSIHPVPDELVYDACIALHHLRAYGVVTSRPTVEPHSAVKATVCPGGYARAKVLPLLRAVAADPSWRP